MENTITVEEKFSKYWIFAAVGLTLCSLISYLIISHTSHSLWEGVLRLISFIFFAGAVLSFLKVFEGKKFLTISMKDNTLHTVCYKNDKKISEHSVKVKKIKYIRLVPYRYEIPLSDIHYTSRDTYDVLIKLMDSDQLYHLIDYAGSALRIDISTAKRLSTFFKQHQVPVKSNLMTPEDHHETN